MIQQSNLNYYYLIIFQYTSKKIRVRYGVYVRYGEEMT